MSVVAALEGLAERHGILRVFRDLDGNNRPTNPETIKALLEADGLDCRSDAAILDAYDAITDEDVARFYPAELIIPARQPHRIMLAGPCSWHLEVEDAPDLNMTDHGFTQIDLPPLPSGVHALKIGPEHITIIAAPQQAPSLHNLLGRSRLWGVTGALYGLRSERNLGVGDFRDLADLSEVCANAGAGFLGINPVHALGIEDEDTISPYSPSHRGFLNTWHIAVDGIPGLSQSKDAAALVEAARKTASGDGEFIDYARHRSVMAPLLEALYTRFEDEADLAAKEAFELYRSQSGDDLADFSLFEAISETHGPDWRKWPTDLQNRDQARRKCNEPELQARMRYHSWLQWVAATQLQDVQEVARRSGSDLGLYLDLAVGPRRGGAETWCQGDSIAEGVSVGAPPDQLSPAGQNWNIAAFAPSKLRATNYSAFRQMLRSVMRSAGMIRIDHVLGLNRSYWIPDNGAPGGYIRQPFQSLLAIVAIEAERSQTIVIGEDLGLVPPGFRDATRARGLYSYSVLQYEKDETGSFRKPQDLRPYSLACFATHDTPTLEGFATGRDIDWWGQLEWTDFEGANRARQLRSKEVADLIELGEGPELFEAVHGALAASPVEMVNIQVDDLMGVQETQNLPGTIDEHPNWRRRAPVDIADFKNLPKLDKVKALMRTSGRSVRTANKETANDPDHS